jgi:hypothetical protein
LQGLHAIVKVLKSEGRLRLLNLLSTGLDIQWGKSVTFYKELANGTVEVHFKDGISMTGSMLIGCDGANSKGLSLGIFDLMYSANQGT